MPGSPIYSRESWKGDGNILLVGSKHGAHTHHEPIVNRLEDFNPDVILVEGNSAAQDPVEWRSAKNYQMISDTIIKPLGTMPNTASGKKVSYKTKDEGDFKKGPFDIRKSGRIQIKASRYLLKYADKRVWEAVVEDREYEMTEKIIKQIEETNCQRVAVIFGAAHVIGVEKILKNLKS
jgi:hypothetical protein